MQEVEAIYQLKNFCLEQFQASQAAYNQNPEGSHKMMKFTKNSIYVITPYNA